MSHCPSRLALNAFITIADYQRHLLYIWLFPEFETQKMEAWGSWAQDAKDGHVYECLAGFGHGPLDHPSGRYMGDTTSIYVLEVYEMYMHTGNKTWVSETWPAVKKAIDWCISNANAPAPNATEPYGLPQKITTTYDHFGFERHQSVTYNAHIYLTALNAAKVLATTAGDEASLAEIEKAFELTQKSIVDERLWNDTAKFFRCHTKDGTEGDNQIFTDSLYGQMLSHHHFGGNFTLAPEYLKSHLAYEWERNADTYGMRVLNDPVQEDSVWMNGPPTWTYLNLALGTPDEAAWEPLKRMSENFRMRLRDMWNLRALTHTDGSVAPAETKRPIELGAPREQGHCRAAFSIWWVRCCSLANTTALDCRRWIYADRPVSPTLSQRPGARPPIRQAGAQAQVPAAVRHAGPDRRGRGLDRQQGARPVHAERRSREPQAAGGRA